MAADFFYHQKWYFTKVSVNEWLNPEVVLFPILDESGIALSFDHLRWKSVNRKDSLNGFVDKLFKIFASQITQFVQHMSRLWKVRTYDFLRKVIKLCPLWRAYFSILELFSRQWYRKNSDFSIIFKNFGGLTALGKVQKIWKMTNLKLLDRIRSQKKFKFFIKNH